MQRLRSLHSEANYTQIPNDTMDILPDFNSLGMLNHILRNRDDFVWDLKKLVSKKSGVGHQAASKARDTLITYGFYIAVKFQHSYRGQFATEIYRSAIPHSEDDLAILHERYRPGSPAQIPLKTDQGYPRDQFGNVKLRDVVVRWAEITSFRGAEVVTGAAPGEDEDEDEPEPEPGYGFPHPGPGCGNPYPGDETGNRSSPPSTGNPTPGEPTSGEPTSGEPMTGSPDPYKKTGGEDHQEDQGENQGEDDRAAARTPPSSEFGCPEENSGYSESVVTTQGDQVGNPLHAREGEPAMTCENKQDGEAEFMTREQAQDRINAILGNQQGHRTGSAA